jgi:hypothetical protein
MATCSLGLSATSQQYLFSQNKPATSDQPAVLFSQNKPAPAISHQSNELAVDQTVNLSLWIILHDHRGG